MRNGTFNRIPRHDQKPQSIVIEHLLHPRYHPPVIQQITGRRIPRNQTGIRSHALSVIILVQTILPPLLRRRQRGIPTPIETVRLPAFRPHHPRVLVDVLVQRRGPGLLRPQNQKGGMRPRPGIEGAIDAPPRLRDDLPGPQRDAPRRTILGTSHREEGRIDVVQNQVHAVVRGHGVGDRVLRLVVHFEYVSGGAVDAIHGGFGEAAAE
mmetsp:Transcript_34726/g.75044  ORF Transcript_34726/g.75044 Transcript_34726/m.75044 type:complete len:209 (-) Transcript_34726:914-1540(-)